MAEPDLGCRVCDYRLIPCGCFLDCVSETVCGSSEMWGKEKSSMNSGMYSLCKMFLEIEGKIVGVDEVHVVEERVRWDGLASAQEQEIERCFSWFSSVCSLRQGTK